MKIHNPLRHGLIALSLCLGFQFGTSASLHAQTLFKSELNLPVRGTSQRATIRTDLKPGTSCVLFDEDTPGCIFHSWMTYTWQKERMIHELVISFYYDGAPSPTIEVTLAQFFSVLLEKDVYPVNNAGLKILPKNALNNYFPTPYEKLRIELRNTGERETSIWYMADFHEYAPDAEVTPLRFQVIPEHASPAGSSYLMADLEGHGFIAGMTKGVRVQDEADSWYHSGGDLLLLDGESNPHAIRGIGGEDVFNMSFGVWPVQTDWVGTLFKTENSRSRARGFEVIMYRIFGPAPIWFDQSAIVRFGARPNDVESVVYAYLAPAEIPPLNTAASWKLAGPFELSSDKDFLQQSTWADGDISAWPSQHEPSFGPYLDEERSRAWTIPVIARSERGWVDFTRYFRGLQPTNMGTQPSQVFGYAVSEISVPGSGHYTLHFSFDDEAILWVDGKIVHRGEHRRGFKKAEINTYLTEGPHQIGVKLSNLDNRQWRLWAFNFSVSPATSSVH